jgi:tetratricopeptide (TPR) repeat protein
MANILSDFHKNLFVVGDPDQTIYSWRGANVEYIMNFDKVHPTAQTLYLNLNYRSSPQIVNSSNTLIKFNKNRVERVSKAVKKDGENVIYCHNDTVQKEAEFVADSIQKYSKIGIKYSEMSILYRAHYCSRAFEEEFLKKEIPFVILSGIGFYERKEVKDILCYLKLVISDDDLAFRRIVNEPRREIGKVTMERIVSHATTNNIPLYSALKEQLSTLNKTKARIFVDMIEDLRSSYNSRSKSITDILSDILIQSGYEAMIRESGEEERLENLAELKLSIQKAEQEAGEFFDLQQYFDSISLYTNADIEKPKQAVKLMTVHSAKGLEFPIVFVVAMNEGIFPSAKTSTQAELEEERRLAYVAMTRAEKLLIITDAEGQRGHEYCLYPSRFIFNVGKTAVNFVNELPDNLIENAQSYITTHEKNIDNPSEYPTGTKVSHSHFGIGGVLSSGSEQSTVISDSKEIEITPTNNMLKIIEEDNMATEQNDNINSNQLAPSVDSLYKRACIFLSDKEWDRADEYFEKILDIDPEYAPAYMGKWLSFSKATDLENAKKNVAFVLNDEKVKDYHFHPEKVHSLTFSDKSFQNAIKYANPEELINYQTVKNAAQNNTLAKCHKQFNDTVDNYYNSGCSALNRKDFKTAKEKFDALIKYYPQNADAQMKRFCAGFGAKDEETLKTMHYNVSDQNFPLLFKSPGLYEKFFPQNEFFKNAIAYADDKRKQYYCSLWEVLKQNTLDYVKTNWPKRQETLYIDCLGAVKIYKKSSRHIIKSQILIMNSKNL